MEQGHFVEHPHSPTYLSGTTNLREGKEHNSIIQKKGSNSWDSIMGQSWEQSEASQDQILILQCH